MENSKLNQSIASGKPQITPSMLRNSANIVCDCGGMIFTEKLFFKKISAIISPSAKEELAPMPIIVCDSCGKVPTMFDKQNVLPQEIKAVKRITLPKVDPGKVKQHNEGVKVKSK